MRITMVISSMQPGGAERVMSILANAWAERNWYVTVVTQEESGSDPFYDLSDNVRYRPLGLLQESGTLLRAALNNWRRVRALRRAIRESNPDVVLSFVDRTNILTLVALVGTKIPIVVSERIDPSQHHIGRAWEFLRPIAYRRARAVVVQTRDASAALGFVRPDRKAVVPNPVISVEEPRTPFKEDPWRRPAVVAMGRLVPQKGFDILLQAFGIACGQNPGWNLAVIGEGPVRDELHRLATSLGIDRQVHFLGRVSRPELILPRADIFVLSSRYEGFPMALCEAMAAGVAVIASDCRSGPRDIIRDGRDGILVPTDDVEALADALDRLMKNERCRRDLGEHARKITSRFGLDQVLREWECVFGNAVLNR